MSEPAGTNHLNFRPPYEVLCAWGTAQEMKEVWLKHRVRCCVNLGGSRGGEGGVAEAPREVLCNPGG